MPTYNVQADMATGEIHVVGNNSRRYSLEELEAAEEAARLGDAAAQAILREVDLSLDGQGRSREREEVLAAAGLALASCPECRAAGMRADPLHTSEDDGGHERTRRGQLTAMKPP